jgi:Pyridoxamine 5'-phosphate oxidase
MAISWTEGLDEIIGGDHVTMLASVTPARGVVLMPVSNMGTRDRDRGTITVNSSVGAWKKLDRIRRNPHVALVFHTRVHGSSDRPEYVLAQGRASLSKPIPDYPETVIEYWEQFEPWQGLNSLWKRWLRVFAIRVEIEVAVERLIVWPDLGCRGGPHVYGAPLPTDPPLRQRAPARGTGPRLNERRAARRASRLPDVLLGWVGADGLPLAVPVDVAGSDARGILLDPPPGLVPAGGRRAGLTAHWFSARVIGQHQRVHTGWLQVNEGESRILYAPHTTAAYRFPPSLTLFQLVAGAGTRWRLRQARRAGALARLEEDGTG